MLRLVLVCLTAGCGAQTSVATYETYEGCEAPATVFTRTVYVDPVNGSDGGDGTSASPWKTLATALTAKQIVAGDHVILLPGDHGAVQVSKYSNAALVDAPAWTWFDVHAGATFSRLDIRDMSRWLITHAEVSNHSGTLVSFAGGSNIVFSDGDLYTERDSSGFSADQWINQTADGLSTRNTHCAALLRNKLTNIRFGISVSSDAKPVPDNQVNVLAKDNQIHNFSGDGMRPIGSNITFAGNQIVDEYVNAADGDANHDDGIQGFALDGAVYDHVVIDGNWIQETTDPNRAFNADLQGISVFDGLYTNMLVTHNVVLTGAYHGIALFGPKDAVIERNTVVGIVPGRKLWITAPPSKTGVVPVNTVVRNNIASTYVLDPAVTSENNPTVTTDEAPTKFVQFDLAKAAFDLHLLPTAGITGAGAY